MAYQTGIIGFVRIPDSLDPNKVYAIGPGGKPVTDENELMRLTGATSIAQAWQLANVKLISPDEALKVGITDPMAKSTTTTGGATTGGTTGGTSGTTTQQSQSQSGGCSPGTTKTEGTSLYTCTPYKGTTPPGAITPAPTWQYTRELTTQEQRTNLQTNQVTTPIYVKSNNSIDVFDISSGTLKKVSAEEFAKAGNPWNLVKAMPTSLVPTKNTNGLVTININGQQVVVPDITVAESLGMDTTSFLNTTNPTIANTPTDIGEYTSGEKLGLVYQSRPDLQQVFNPDGTAKPGTTWEGTTIWDWATRYGYKENPDLLSEYSPENIVRAAYQMKFGRDPFAEGDTGAMDWVNAIKQGYVVGWADLTGKMEMDAGSEWKNLTEAQKTANLIDYQQLIQDIPEFAEFFPKDQALADIQKEVNAFYDKEIENYNKQMGIKQHRSEEDWSRYTEELSIEEQNDLTDAEKQARSAIQNARESYGMAGTIFSSLAKGKDTELKDALARQKSIIQLKADQAQGKLDTEKARELEDLQLAQEEYLTKVARQKVIETEQTFASQEERAIGRYNLGLQQAANVPGNANIFGQSVGTAAGQFSIPTDGNTSQNTVDEIFGNLNPTNTTTGTTTTTCPVGQKLVNGVCVPITTTATTANIWTGGSQGGVISEADYQKLITK